MAANPKVPGVYNETKRCTQKAWVKEELDLPDGDSGEATSKYSQTESAGMDPQGGHNQCYEDVVPVGNPSQEDLGVLRDSVVSTAANQEWNCQEAFKGDTSKIPSSGRSSLPQISFRISSTWMDYCTN